MCPNSPHQLVGLGGVQPNPTNWPVWVCPKRPARRPAAAPKAPRPQGRPTGVRGPARARRGQNISLVRDGGERLPGSAPSSRIYISARDYPPPGPRLGPSRPRRSPRPPGDGARPAWQGGAPRTHRQLVSLGCVQPSPTNWPIRVCPKRPGIRVRVPPSGRWPRPRNQLASPGSARGHAPRRPIRPPTPTGNWPAATPPQGHRPSGLPDRRRRPGWRAAATGAARAGAGGGGTPGRGRRRTFRLARGVTPACPTARLPATPRLTRRRSRPSSRAPLARWLLASLYTLRPHLGGKTVGNPWSVPKIFLGTLLTM